MLKNFMDKKPLVFCVLFILIWMLFSGLFAFIFSLILDEPMIADLPQTVARIAGTLFIIAFAWKMGWLKKIGITASINLPTALVTSLLIAYLVIAGRYAYFGAFSTDFVITANSPEGIHVVLMQVFVAISEEFLFRGVILFVLYDAWKDRKLGVLASALISGLLFSIPHMIYIFFSTNTQDVTIALLNTFYAGLQGFWLAVLVLFSGTLWPAVLLHFASNASILIEALNTAPLVPVSAYTRLILAELPLVAAGVWLLRMNKGRNKSAYSKTFPG